MTTLRAIAIVESKRLGAACSAAWTAIQVERHGKYSAQRLHRLVDYKRSTSLARAWLVLMATPLPCFIAITLLDAIPLKEPSMGVAYSQLFWLRTFLTGTCLCATIMVQLRQSVAWIPIANAQIAWISMLSGAFAVAFSVALASRIGYPLPFTLALSGPVGCVTMSILSAAVWRQLLRNSCEARSALAKYIGLVVKQVSLIYIYPLYSYVFNAMGAHEQTAFALLLPVIKLAVKNWINTSVIDVDDLRPEIIIFNVEVFHALHVIYSMQSAVSLSTIVVLVLVDGFTSCASLRRLCLLSASARSKAVDVQSLPSSRSIEPSSGDTRQQIHPGEFGASSPRNIRSSSGSNPNLLEVALYILEIDESIAQRSSISVQPSRSHARQSAAAIAPEPQSQETRQTSAVHREGLDTGRATIPDEAPPGFSSGSTNKPSSALKAAALSSDERRFVRALGPLERRQQVAALLRLLHMTEFLLLVEYTEVMIPVVYCLYLLVMSHLPNRLYYAQFKDTDDDALHRSIANILLYLSLELASFLLLSVVLSRKLAISGIRQVAFVLESQWEMVQAKLVLWVVFVAQSPLEHNGVDYSFQFKWLRADPQRS